MKQVSRKTERKISILLKALLVLSLVVVFGRLSNGVEDVSGAEQNIASGASSDSSSISATVLLIDTSGSMDDADVSGRRKIEAAIEAASNVVDLLQADNELLSNRPSYLGIVEFNTFSRVVLGLTTDFSSATSILNSLTADGGTGMPDGLRASIDLLSNAPPEASRIIILLSDGMANVGLGGNENLSVEEVRQQLYDLAGEAGSKGICIYTIGLGVPGEVGGISGEVSIDIELLQQLPAIAGCGGFYQAQNAGKLNEIYLKLRHESVGTILLEKEGVIHQGEEIRLEEVQVANFQDMLLYTVNWEGSKIEVKLRDPTGLMIDGSQENVKMINTSTMTALLVLNPLPGSWQALMYGFEIPKGEERYKAILSVRGSADIRGVIEIVTITPPPIVTPPIPPTPIVSPQIQPTPIVSPPIPPMTNISSGGDTLIWMFIFILAIIGWLFYQSSQNRVRPLNKPSYLIGINGIFYGRTFPLFSYMLIGRSSDCHICIPELTVSRRHCQIFLHQGRWILRDLGSSHGTYVNNVPIVQIVLTHGDLIRIGNEIFRFEGS